MTLDTTRNATLSALFETQSAAEHAVNRLVDLGVSRTAISLMPGYEKDEPVHNDVEVHQGFFSALSNFFMPDEDRYSYAEGLKRGGFLVTVTDVSDALYDQALDVLDDEGAIDLDQQEEEWRSGGWNGYQGSSSTGTGYSSTAGSAFTSTTGTASAPASGASDYSAGTSATGYSAGTGGTYAATDTLGSGREEVIPVVEESLKVGKRDVSHGRVRVRSYVREEPVSADVNLRNERVTLERRPVDREVSAADIGFEDRTIEAEEYAEEAVVQKQARVVEEIALRKDVEQETQTISDTVKKTEVEVEDERGNIDRTGTTGAGWTGGTTR